MTIASLMLILLLLGSRISVCGGIRALFKAILGKTVVNGSSVETHINLVIGHGEVRHA